MKTSLVKHISIHVLTTIVFSLFAIAYSSPYAHPPSDGIDHPIDITNLSDNNLWTKVNEHPYRISSYLDALCRIPTPIDYADARRKDPHATAYVNVYVNKIGAPAISSKQHTLFPIGSVLVKEKFYSDGSELKEKRKPNLFTVMVKRESGYNPEAGDWEFAVVSGDGKQIQARGKLASCMSCHVTQRGNDYVFRSYMWKSGR